MQCFYARGIDSSFVFTATPVTAPGIHSLTAGDIGGNTALLMTTQCRNCRVLQFIPLFNSIHKAGLSICREIRIFPRTAGNTGNRRELLGNINQWARTQLRVANIMTSYTQHSQVFTESRTKNRRSSTSSGTTYLHLQELIVQYALRRREVELGELQRRADAVADVRVEEEGHAPRAQVAVPVVSALGRVDLRVRPQVADALDVDDDQVVAGLLEREVAERLRQREETLIYLSTD